MLQLVLSRQFWDATLVITARSVKARVEPHRPLVAAAFLAIGIVTLAAATGLL